MTGTPSSEKLREVTELALEASPEAVRRLVALMRSRDEQVALGACMAILDRAYGKPQQPISVKLIVERKTLEQLRDRNSERHFKDG
jgi:hypothetical protein